MEKLAKVQFPGYVYFSWREYCDLLELYYFLQCISESFLIALCSLIHVQSPGETIILAG